MGSSFQPHGMDIYKEDGLLYVINHSLGKWGEKIEVFKVECDTDDIPKSIRYLYSITNEQLNRNSYGNLNSIAVVEAGKFYLS